MIKLFKYFFLATFFFLLSCLNDFNSLNELPSEDRVTTTAASSEEEEDEEEIEEDVDEDEEDDAKDRTDDLRERERNRLKSDFSLRAKVDSRYSSGGSSSFKGDDTCKEFSACADLCDKIIEGSKSKCLGFDFSIVEDMEDVLFTIRDIEDADRVSIDPYIFEALLDAGKSTIEDLVEDDMGEGDLKSFLAWVALNEEISEVLDKKDTSGKILEKAFYRLGKFQDGTESGVGNYQQIGLSTGLITDDDTFLYLATDSDNEEGMIMGYDIVKSKGCRGDVCIKKVLCARENRTRSRSSYRYFGNIRGVSVCRTSASNRSRSSLRSSSCYVHGSAVWSFLYDLIDEKKIKSVPDELKAAPLSVDKCNASDVCGKNLKKNSPCEKHKVGKQ
ncbi:MAG: hypothetical protein ACR2M7_03935 [Bdellovibrionales bacterium]